MKTKIISKLKKEILVIEFPEGYELAGVTYGAIYYYDNQMNDEDYPLSILVEGSYTLLGKPDEIKEEDVHELIPMYYDYAKTAVEYIIEALESEIYWNVNPLGEEPILEAICCGNLRSDAWGYPQCCGVPNATEESIELHSMWNEAQENTFDRNRSIILVKN